MKALFGLHRAQKHGQNVSFCLMISLLIILFIPTFATSSSYNAVNDFGSTNPTAPWSYGYETTLGGSFTLFANYTGSYASMANWLAWMYGANPSTPVIAKNNTSSTLIYSTLTQPIDVLLMHPGNLGEYAVLRFTAPTTDTYNISAIFSGLDTTTTDVNILKNNVGIFSDAITGFGDTGSSASSLSMIAGDTLDFAVGYGSGSNNTYLNDSTGLKFTADISTVPEPATMLLFGLGLIVLAGVRRKFQN